MFILLILILVGISITSTVFAVEYTPIVDLPRVGDNGLTTEAYVRALYLLSITLAALLAIVKIIFAGVKYVLSDVVTDKGGAIKDIRGALLGLLIVLSAVLILNTINPNLTQLQLFRDNAPKLKGMIDTRSHDEIREEERLRNPIIKSTFSGRIGSPEHQRYVNDCRAEGGRVIASVTDAKIVECRTKE